MFSSWFRRLFTKRRSSVSQPKRRLSSWGHHLPLRLEALEDRTSPAIGFQVSGGIVTFADDNAGLLDNTLTLRLNAGSDRLEYQADGGGAVNVGSMKGLNGIIVNLGGGDDALVVDSSNGAIPGILTYHGGAGFDFLILQGGTASSDVYSPGPTPDAGRSVIVMNGVTQTVNFTGLEPVIDTVPSPTLIVNGTAANNAINYTQGSVAANGLVSVDNFETIEFSNKDNLVINGLGGTDQISLNNPTRPTGQTPGGLKTITVNGADPTASDTLVVNGIPGQLDNLRYLPTSVGAGTVINDSAPQPNVLFTGIEHLTTVVQQADGDGVRVDGTTGNDAIEFFHGLTSDSGLFVGTMDQNNATGSGPFSMTPINFTGASPLGNDADVNFFNPGGTDSFVFNGTANDDNLVLRGGEAGGTEFRNTLNGILVSRVEVFNIASTLVRALAGNDTINVNVPAGPAAVTIRVEGGDSDQFTDTLNYTAPLGAATTIDFATSTITGPGANPVTFSGVERVNETSSGAGSTLTINGTINDDNFQVTASGAGAGSFVRQGLGGSPEFTYTGASTITFNGGPGGFDILTILGNGGVDTVTSTANTVTRAGGTITVGTDLDRLDVNTFGGNDTIVLTTFSALPTQIDAGDGDDQVFGSTQPDLIFGGSGNDFLIGGGANDVIFGGDGDDRFGDPLARDPAANDPGNDQFFGEGGSDEFFWDPGDGDDLVEGGAGDSDQIFFFGNAGGEQFFLFAEALRPSRFHLFRVQAAIDIDAADVEEVNLTTLGGTDTVTVGRSDLGTPGDLSTTTVRVVDVSLGADGAADNVIFEGRSLDDNLLISVSAGFVKVAGLSYDLRIDGADSALDRLTINANEGNDTVKADPGVEAAILIALNGGAGNDYLSADAVINGNEGNDTLVGGSGNDTMDGGQGDDTFIGNGGTDAIGGGGSSSVGDTILVQGTTGNDTISLTLNASGHLVATVNGLTTTYTNFIGGPIATSGIEHIQIDGQAGNDTLTVDSSNGAISIPINFDGENNADLLILTGGTATSDIYTPGPQPGSGTSVLVIGGITQTVSFSNLEPVLDLVAGPLVVNGTNADNAINYSQGSVAANGLVSVDGFETIEFSNKTTLTINGLAGSDTINLNNPTTPTGLTSITVDGGDPTGTGDTLIVNGIPGVADNLRVTPTGTGAGTLSGLPFGLTFSGLEGLTVVGQAADNDSINFDGTAGDDTFEFTPGTIPDAGTVTGFRAAGFSFTPVSFSGFSQLTGFGSAGIVGTDTLIVNGTAADDVFGLANSLLFPGAPSLSLNNRPPIVFNTQFSGLVLRGLAGNDQFALNYNPPSQFADPVRVEGGDGTDTITHTANTGAATTINLAVSSIASTGANTVTFAGVEQINQTSSGAASTLSVTGTDADDTINVTPAGAGAGSFTASAIPGTTFTYTGVGGAFTVTGGAGGFDTLGILGNDNANVAVVTLTTVTLDGGVVTLGAGLDRLTIQTLGGADTVTTTPLTGISQLLDLGGPGAGDALNVNVPGSARVSQSIDATAGTIDQLGGALGNIDFVGVEVLPINSNVAGSTLTTRGTQGNDTIAAGNIGIVAVWINAGTVIRFNSANTNFSALTVQGLFGTDTFSITPVAGVTITVQGGDPTTGDTAVINGTTGTDTINFSPTAFDAATVQVNALGLVILQTIESVTINGQTGGDNLTVTTPTGPNGIVLTPGATPDTGTVAARLLGGGGPLVPLQYTNLGAFGSLNLANASGIRSDFIDFYGTDASEQFIVSAGGLVQILDLNANLFKTVLVTTPGVTGLTLHGLAGDDTFSISDSGVFTFGVVVDGGDPSASDTLNLTGDGATPVVLGLGASAGTGVVTGGGLGTVTLLGIEVLNLDAGGAAASVVGTASDDVITVKPVSATAGSLTANNLAPAVHYSNTASLTVSGGVSGFDTLVIQGNDNANIVVVTATTVTLDGGVVTLGAGLDRLTIQTFGGADTVSTTPLAGISQLLDLGGPGAGDTLTVNVPGSARVSQSIDATSGTIDQLGGTLGNIDYVGVEVLPINSSALGSTLTTRGTLGNDTIAAGNIGIVAVWINAGTVIRFNLANTNFTALTVQGLFGTDTFSITPVAGVAITVQGGDPTVGDTAVINGTTGTDTITFSPTSFDAATVLVNALGLVTLQTIENVSINGLGGGDSLTVITPNVAAGDLITYTPGPAVDAGSVGIESVTLSTVLVPLAFVSLGTTGSVTFIDGAAGNRRDALLFKGTPGADVINVTANFGGLLTLLYNNNFHISVRAPGVSGVTIDGLAGNDSFVVDTAAGAIPFGVTVEGGEGTDDVQLLGDGTAIEVFRIGAPPLQVLGGGLSIGELRAVESVGIVNNPGDITFNTFGPPGTVYDVTPTAAREATIRTGANMPVFTIVTAGALTLNGILGNSDVLSVNGTTANDTITVTATTIQVNALKTVTYSAATIGALRIFGHEGSDTFNVSPGTLPIFVDGGDPIGGTPGDLLNVTVGPNPVTLNAGPENDEGSVVAGALAPISFDEVETIALTGAGAGSSATINATNGDDDINVIGTGTQDFTVSINAGLAVQYIDVPTLTLNALAGDDDIAINPFFGAGGWQMTIFVNGNDPVASDKLVVAGNAAANAVAWTPLTGVLLLDGGAATTAAITVATTEQLIYNGLGGGDSVQVNGTGTFTYRAGTTTDAGSIALDSLLPLSFQGLGPTGTVTVNSTGAADTLVIEGTNFSDTFVVNAASVRLNAQLAVSHNLTTGDRIILHGSTSAGDSVNFTGGGAPVTVGLGPNTLQETGLAAVILLGIEFVNLNVSAAALTVNGTIGDDTIGVTPTAAAAGSFSSTASVTVYAYTSVGAFTVNGDLGFDVLAILGNDADNVFGSSATSVTLNGGAITAGTGLERLDVLALGGNDIINLAAFTALPTHILAGDGDDTVTGTPQAELIEGGAGNDVLNGGAGNDTLLGQDGNDRLDGDQGSDQMFGGAGSDTIVWDPGDGSDLVEGGEGVDVLLFNGAGAAEVFTLNAIGARFQFLRNVGNIVMDCAGIEQLNLLALGGLDTVIVNDVSATELRSANIDLGGADGFADVVTVFGTAIADLLTIGQSAGAVSVNGLPYTISLTGIEAASDTLTVNGGGGDDVIGVVAAADTAIRIGIDGGTGSDKLDLSALTTARTLDLAAGTLTGFASIANVESFVGTLALDTIIGPNTANSWTLTGPNAGTVNGTTFASFENVGGGNQADLFAVSAGATLSGTLNGGDGSDTLVGGNTGNVFSITANNAGNLNAAIFFVAVENLTGGNQPDVFLFADGQGVSGRVDGGPGVDTLNYSASTLPISVNLQTQTASSTGGIASIENLIGGNAIDILTGLDIANVWNLTGPDGGSVGGFTFLSVESVIGGALNDSFTVTYGGATNRTVAGGTGGFDVVNLLGSDGANIIVAPTAIAVTIDGQTVSLGAGLDLLTIQALGGNDNINLALLTIVPVQLFAGEGDDVVVGTSQNDLIDGGPGNDILNGGAGNDSLFGGDGDDRLDGDQGSDQMFGGAGSDTIVWDPGDGSDLVEGGEGIDVLLFNGAAAAEIFSVNAVGSRFQFTRNLGNIVMDCAGIEQLNLFALGGADTVTVNDVSATELRTINIDLGPADAASDSVTVNGRDPAESLAIGLNAGVVSVSGLRYDVHIANTEAANDNLTLRGNAGNDIVSVTDGANTAIRINLEGGAGNADTLDLSGLITGVTIDLTAGTISGFGTVSGFESFVGTAGNDTLIGTNVASVWNLVGTNSGTVNGVAFAGVENLTGGSAADTFLMGPAATIAGTIAGSGGTDTLNYGGFLSAVTVNLQAGTATGTGGISGIEGLIGGNAIDTLIATNSANAWNLVGNNAGTINGTFTFSGIENLTGGTSADTFTLANNASLTGLLDGGAGADAISFAAFTSARIVKLTGLGATDGFNGTEASLGGGLANVESLSGSTVSDTLTGRDAPATWTVSSTYTSGSRTLTFVSFETLNGGTSTDVFTVSVPSVSSALSINGGGQTGDAVTLDDVADPTPNTVSITSTQVGAAAGNNFFPTGGSLTYSGLGSLTVNLGSGNDTITVVSKAATTATLINSGGGADTFNVSVTSTTGLANLTLDGSAGADTLNISDLSFGSVIRTTAISPTEARVDVNYLPGTLSQILTRNLESVAPNLTPEQSFVQALYHDVLGRSGSSQELAGWIDVLRGTNNRMAVVAGIENSLEGIRQRVRGWYVQFLNREAHNNEESPWVNMISRGVSEEQTLSGILASAEYFNLAGGTNDGYVRRLYQQLLNRSASNSEVQIWLNALPSIGRIGIALMIQQSNEYRTLIVSGYYTNLLRRPTPPSQAETDIWVLRPLDIRGIRFGIESSNEFFANGF